MVHQRCGVSAGTTSARVGARAYHMVLATAGVSVLWMSCRQTAAGTGVLGRLYAGSAIRSVPEGLQLGRVGVQGLREILRRIGQASLTAVSECQARFTRAQHCPN